MVRLVLGLTFVAAVIALSAACGGKNPTSPSSTGGMNNTGAGGSSNCPNATVGPLGCAKGMITGTLAGASYVGGVPTGQSTYTPVAPVNLPNGQVIPAQDFFVIQGTSVDLTSLLITARAKVGTAALGQGVFDPELNQPTVNNAQLQTRSSSALTGQWNTNIAGGSGTITVTAVSTAGASGSFSFTMVPQAGTGATGNRIVTGTFNVTF